MWKRLQLISFYCDDKRKPGEERRVEIKAAVPFVIILKYRRKKNGIAFCVFGDTGQCLFIFIFIYLLFSQKRQTYFE